MDISSVKLSRPFTAAGRSPQMVCFFAAGIPLRFRNQLLICSDEPQKKTRILSIESWLFSDGIRYVMVYYNQVFLFHCPDVFLFFVVFNVTC